MTVTCGSKFILSAVAAVVVAWGAAPARADLAARLGDLLGQERQVLGVVPQARLTALGEAPAIAVDPVSPPAPATETLVAAGVGAHAALADGAVAAGGAEWRCLSEALYFEARGESTRGLFAVGEVVLNRRDAAGFPNTICGVVNQNMGTGLYNCQFTFRCDGKSDAVTDQAAWDRVGRVARALMDGAPRDLTAGATHYHTTAVSPSWAASFPRTAQVGVHQFYRQPLRTAAN